MAYKKRTVPTVFKTEPEPVVEEKVEAVEEPAELVVEEVTEVFEIKDEAVVEVVPIVEEKVEPIVIGHNQINIDRLKIKLLDGTITDGEAAEYRSLMGYK